VNVTEKEKKKAKVLTRQMLSTLEIWRLEDAIGRSAQFFGIENELIHESDNDVLTHRLSVFQNFFQFKTFLFLLEFSGDGAFGE
jgi:hypothetical protein